MAIQQTKKQSDLEKRLQLLRRQVYGKREVSSIQYPVSSENNVSTVSHNTKYAIRNTDVNYLYHDLLKILIFSSLAIGMQIVLFILSTKHVLNLNFF